MNATLKKLEQLPEISLDLEAGSRVVVAMSGGVDSSVAAALVARAGYETIGMTMQLYDTKGTPSRKGACCAGQDIHDARAVAAQLDIPHYVLDYESRFRESVMEDFVESYLAGETPIPCIRCNESVKFRDLIAQARALDAQAMVTGHYIASKRGETGWQMHRPRDLSRDQSYFLFSTTQEQLDYLRFPLAALTKEQIRDHAHALGLNVAAKPDSQDICFVPDGDYAGVIKRLRPDCSEAGLIKHIDGEVIGQHQGVIHYTIGQRRGLGIALGEPLYVVGIDAQAREVIVGPREALARTHISLQEVNWLGDTPLSTTPQDILARIRSTSEPTPATIVKTQSDQIEVALTKAEEGVSAGQACVFYAPATASNPSTQLLGGGWIKS